jgi:hypothetical protein
MQLLSLPGSAANSWAAERLYKMTGYITAIDRPFNTVVIEVTMVGKSLTVGAHLPPTLNWRGAGTQRIWQIIW